MFLIELPDDFDPALWGWVLNDRDFDVAWHRIWLRWHIPWLWPAALSRTETNGMVLWAFTPTGADERSAIAKDEVMAQIY